jgi:hypothetical protein
MVAAPVRRKAVRHLVTCGFSERHALAVVAMSASSLRYVPAPDPNVALRARIVALAHRHRRYGAGMIYLKVGRPATGSITRAWSGSTPRRVCRSVAVAARRFPWPSASRCCGRSGRSRCGRRTSCSIARLKVGY